MNLVLPTVAQEYRTLLAAWLPPLHTNWWEHNVVALLTYRQQEHLKQSRISELSGLDLAALLRVLDQNWSELSGRFDWPREGRNWLKEAQTIRNRWAHAATQSAEPQDAYRDIDTLQRLSKMLGVSEVAQSQLAEYKQQQFALLLSSRHAAIPPSPIPTAGEQPPTSPAAEVALVAQVQDGLVPGQLVRLKSNRDKVFPVLSALSNSGAERRYLVFEDNKQANYYESQLEAVPDVQVQHSVLPLAEFHARLTSLLLAAPSGNNL